jgi:ABC-type polar amino acid transport system ATPase subunit
MSLETDAHTTARLRLVEMTLRGVGPYLDGARLEIRPLTVLCGPNGSGKSTWARVLDQLRKSWKSFLPYGLCEKESSLGPSYLNAAVAREEPGTVVQQGPPWDFKDGHLVKGRDKLERIEFENDDSDFGPPGTVGLTFECLADFSLGAANDALDAASTPAAAFLWNGQCSRGSRIAVRFTQVNSDQTRYARAEVGFDLCYDDSIVRFRKMAFNGRAVRVLGREKAAAAAYRVSCSPSFLPGILSGEPDSLQEISGAAPAMDAIQIDAFQKVVVDRYRQVLAEFFEGYFFISAFRVPQYESQVSSEDHGLQNRWVGPSGERALELERLFAYSPMVIRADGSLPYRPEPSGWPFVLESYVSWWLEKLVNVRIGIASEPPGQMSPDNEIHEENGVRKTWCDSLSDPWRIEERLPQLYLPDNEPRTDAYFTAPAPYTLSTGLGQSPLVTGAENHFDFDRRGLQRFLHPCFGDYLLVLPQRLSAGFHQIVPAIVQSALMLPQELMVLENPEVHLHPSLQLLFTEFLIEQAASGRMIIVETHSDLVLRRIIREVLEEKYGIGQQKLGLYFVSGSEEFEGASHDDSSGTAFYRMASLKRLDVDAKGRIANWPDGFLDDDVRESRRLLEIMYGGSRGEDEDV